MNLKQAGDYIYSGYLMDAYFRLREAYQEEQKANCGRAVESPLKDLIFKMECRLYAERVFAQEIRKQRDLYE